MKINPEAFKKAREALSLSTRQLAHKAGVSEITINKIEAKQPRIDMIRKIVIALELSFDEAREKGLIMHDNNNASNNVKD
ncbi:MAG: helix-turn-helix domain-containing protein [Deltaproteobacteria bacterium]|jgi:predicted transcriptional regulator|nr:helix-turn-helix domain-containing protein [Deltaproteobacteria bacterium]